MLPRGLLKEHWQFLSLLLRALDVCAVAGSGLLAYSYRFGHVQLDKNYQIALLLSALFTLIVFQSAHIYTSMRGQSFWITMRRLLQAVMGVCVLLASAAFITKTGVRFSREWFLLWTFFAVFTVFSLRCGLLIILRLMRSWGWNEKCVVMIGANKLSYKLVETMQQSLWTGFRITTILDDETTLTNIHGIPVLTMPPSLSSMIAHKKETIDEIWLALPLRAEEQVKALLYELRHCTIPVRYMLNVYDLGIFNPSISHVAGMPTLNINNSPMTGINRLIKALEDRMIAALILVAISPLFALLALGVKLSSNGPVFFKQLRHGWDGRVIKVYKFRTMKLHAERAGALQQATLQDERITAFGKFLRRTSLDELPQFINVLQGRMSIVGPRPHALLHNEQYKESINAYMQRHQVKPGITGWAQINGWRGETNTLEKMQKRIEHDLFYIENWSLFFDLKIMLLTLFRGFINKNAY